MMNRSYQVKQTLNPICPKELSRKAAIHEAGHAAAIYLGNKRKQLPPVFFQIVIEKNTDGLRAANESATEGNARIEGGRLIHTLPFSMEEAVDALSLPQKASYQSALEADVINLLVGPLAEANYVALRDGETINPRLVNLNALHNYGGTFDLQLVNDYMTCCVAHSNQREKKVFELFLMAFSFINDLANWYAITVLADYILAHDHSVIGCEEIIAVLDDPFFATNKNIWF
jgi:hypothetical protein